MPIHFLGQNVLRIFLAPLLKKIGLKYLGVPRREGKGGEGEERGEGGEERGGREERGLRRGEERERREERKELRGERKGERRGEIEEWVEGERHKLS
jgi:hypothetical protein